MDPLDARLLDEMALAATPAETEAMVLGWRCRCSPGLPFRRAQAAVPPLAGSTDPEGIAGSLPAIRAWHDERGSRLIVQVSESHPRSDEVDVALAGAGLVTEAPVHVLVASGPAHEVAPASDSRTTVVVAGIDTGWAESEGTIGEWGSQAERALGYGRMLAPLGERVLGASVRRDGVVVGTAIGVVDRGWVGLFAMATAPGWRRQGIGSELVRALRSNASEQGAERAYLQVETDNAAAIALYGRLGFGRSHGYHYRSDANGPAIGC